MLFAEKGRLHGSSEVWANQLSDHNLKLLHAPNHIWCVPLFDFCQSKWIKGQVSKTVFLLKVFKSASLLWIEEYKIQVQLVLVVLVQVQDPLGVVSHETGGCKK